MMSKGLGVNELPTLALAIIIIGVVVVVGISINDGLQESEFTTRYYNDTSVSTTNNTYLSIDVANVKGIVSAGNSSSPYTAIGTGNFTTIVSNESTTTSSVLFSGWNGYTAGQTNWVYVTYEVPNDANLAARNSTTGVEQISTQLSLVGLIVVMAVIIGILWTSFGFRNSNGGI